MMTGGVHNLSHELSWHEGDQPFSEQFGDHFYSRADGRGETGHVFIGGNRLPGRWAGVENFTIGELGFGTGLNFLETWRVWKATRQIGQTLIFVSFEGFPLESDQIERAISRWPELAPLTARFLEFWPRLSGEPNDWALDSQTRLRLVRADALTGLANWNDAAHAWYLDGFSPARNPDMWSPELMCAVYGQTVSGGTIASYTVAGWVRRNLQSAGFDVCKEPGFAGKREMLCGVKPDAL